MPSPRLVRARVGHWEQAGGLPFTANGVHYYQASDFRSDSVQRARNGSNDFLFRVDANSYDSYSLANGKPSHRAEIIGYGDFIPYGTPCWASFEQTFYEDTPFDCPWLLCGQFHQTPDNGETSWSPPLSAQFDPSGQWQVRTLGDANATTLSNPTSTGRFFDAALIRGRSYRHVINATFDPVAGSLKWWRDGVKIIDVSGIPMGYNDVQGVYFQFGIYRGAPCSSVLRMRYRNVEVGLSDLSARIASPLP